MLCKYLTSSTPILYNLKDGHWSNLLEYLLKHFLQIAIFVEASLPRLSPVRQHCRVSWSRSCGTFCHQFLHTGKICKIRSAHITLPFSPVKKAQTCNDLNSKYFSCVKASKNWHRGFQSALALAPFDNRKYSHIRQGFPLVTSEWKICLHNPGPNRAPAPAAARMGACSALEQLSLSTTQNTSWGA